MRCFMRVVIVAVVILSAGSSSRAQDASKIIDRYVRATGGAKALKKTQTVTLEGSLAGDSPGKSGAGGARL